LKLASVKIGRQLDMSNATFMTSINADGMQVDGNLLLGNSKFAKTPSIKKARIDGDLDLLRARLPGLDLSGTVIGGALRLAEGQYMVEWDKTEAEAKGLVLRATRVKILQDGIDPASAGACGAKDSWPDKLDLQGFAYDQLGAISDNPRLDLRSRDPCWYESWLRRDPRFAYQPYQQMAGTLRALGDRERADEVLYAARERDRRNAWEEGDCGNLIKDWPWRRADCLTATGLGILMVTVGYGIGGRTLRVLWCALGLTGLGVAFLWFSAAARKNGPIWCVGASLDRLLPIVVLNPEFADFFNDPPPRKRLCGWQQAYFAVHAIVGFLLGCIVVAAFAGLTQTG
ncbi:MAG: hypothetical protein ABW003_25085, partial [Microvirga sp.]